jgi:hypothetical protein
MQAQQVPAARHQRDLHGALAPTTGAVSEVRELGWRCAEIGEQSMQRFRALHFHHGAEHGAAVKVHGLHGVAVSGNEVEAVPVAREELSAPGSADSAARRLRRWPGRRSSGSA